MDTEILLDDTLSTITRAFISLEGLFNLPAPPSGSHPDLLKRVWPWAQFFDVHLSWIAGAPTEDAVVARFFCVIVSLMETFSPTSRQIASTPGIGILAARAWGSYFRDPNHSSEAALRRLASFLITASTYGYEFDEFVDGAGGTDALAVLVVRLVDYLLSSINSGNTTYRTAAYMCGVVQFAALSQEDAWRSALRSHKYLRALTSVLLFADRFLQAGPATDVYASAPGTGFFLFCYIATVIATLWRLLMLVFSHSSFRLPANMWNGLTMEPTSKPAFISSALNRDWQEFVKLALGRLEVKQHFDSGQYLTHKACDNMECGKILRKANFKRCAGCEYQHYCSKECQISDWRTGHRTMCQHTRPPDGWRVDHLDGPVYFTGRDRAFRRAIVANDYERHKEDIFLTRIVQMRQHGEYLYTLFKYSNGQVHIDVQPSLEQRHYFDRAARSGQRMHVIIVIIAHDVGYWVLLTRSNDSCVHDALVIVTEGIPPGTDAANLSTLVVQAVRRMIRMCRPSPTDESSSDCTSNYPEKKKTENIPLEYNIWVSQGKGDVQLFTGLVLDSNEQPASNCSPTQIEFGG
ncbi:hypothetical protein B0H13DRAFT_2564669 [Mycena leptocephala]|nr:hypothetical protein B0H13DRAFT_2564669 [Mycena leptocephala]